MPARLPRPTGSVALAHQSRYPIRMRIIRAILFDLGDTLWRTASTDPPPGPSAVVPQVLDLLSVQGQPGVSDPVAFVRALWQAGWQASAAAYAADLRSPDFAAVTMQVAEDFGLRLERAAASKLWDAANGGAALPPRTLVPGALEVLRALRGQGIALGLVTNRMVGGAVLADELQRYGLLRLFDVRLVSCDIGWLKPQPRVFTTATGALGVRAVETAVVGDSLRADVSGAKAAGMTAIWLRPEQPSPEDRPSPMEYGGGPDFAIRTLPELLELPLRFEPRMTGADIARGTGRG